MGHRKGVDVLIGALARLSEDLEWTCTICGGGDTEKYFPAVMSSARSLQNLLSEGMIASASAGKIQFSQKALGKKEDILSSFPFGAPPLLGTGPLGPGELTAYQKGLPEYLRDYTTVSRAAMRLQAGIT